MMQNSNFGSIIKKFLKLISITELLLRHLRHAKFAKFFACGGLWSKTYADIFRVPYEWNQKHEGI